MKSYEGYVLVSEISDKANKSRSWLYLLVNTKVEHIEGTAVVKVSTLEPEYQEIAKQCQDLKYYYPYTAISTEIGRIRNFINVLEIQRRNKNKPPFDFLKVQGHKLLKLSEEFVNLINQGFTPYKINELNYNKEDYKHIIKMQGMKIGFY